MKTKLEDYINFFVLDCKIFSFFQPKQKLFYKVIHSQHSKKFLSLQTQMVCIR